MRLSTKTLILAVLTVMSFVASHGASAQESSDWALLVGEVPDGTRLETRLDTDLSGDGLIDTVLVVRGDNWRTLKVLVAANDGSVTGHPLAGEMALDPLPISDARLSESKGVLIVEDVYGDASAIASIYRYRYERGERRMRLIGDEVQVYSRTEGHDSLKITTNRLTGQRVREVGKLGDNGKYVQRSPLRESVSTDPIYMEQAPAPEAILGFGQ